MESKRRGRPCKEEKMTNHSIRLDKEDQDSLEYLSRKLKVSQAEAMRIAIKSTRDSVLFNKFRKDSLDDAERYKLKILSERLDVTPAEAVQIALNSAYTYSNLLTDKEKNT